MGGYAVVFDDGLTRWDGCDGMVAAPRYLALGIGWRVFIRPGPWVRRAGGWEGAGSFFGRDGGVVFFLAGTRRFAVGGFSSEVRHIGR